MDQHTPRGLLDGLNMTLIGGPSRQLPAAPAAAEGAAGQGAWTTLVKLPGDVGHAKDPQKIERVPLILTAAVYAQQGTGPVVGRALFGAGNGTQQIVEFDVQIGFALAATPGITGASSAGGSLLSVPATSLQVDVRNDANLIVSGPKTGGALSVKLGDTSQGTPLVTGSMGQGPRAGSSQLIRTVYVRNQAANGVPQNTSVQVPVPAFAQRFRVFRLVEGVTVVPSINVSITDVGFVPMDGPYTEAAGAPPATYRLPGGAAVVVIKNNDATALKTVGCIFELAI